MLYQNLIKIGPYLNFSSRFGICAIFAVSVPLLFLSAAENQCVTYKLTGRLGNNLIAYFHAKWISYKYGLPLIFKPFKYSEDFAFHHLEKEIFVQRLPTFDARVSLEGLDLLNIEYPNLLYEVPYFRDVGPEPEKRVPARFYTDWDDPGFKEILKSHLKSVRPLNCVTPPQGKINVLVHIRTGGGYDLDFVKLKMPLKFPPMSFYINALRRISAHFKHRPIYAFIMTDDSRPQRLARIMRQNLPYRKNIEWDWRKGEAGHDVNVLDDFFSIPNFQCLIRADSTFSEMASRLGDYDIVVTPTRAHVDNDRAIIDQIDFKIKK